MPSSTSLKKTIQKQFSDITTRIFEELSKTKATDKIKKTLSKSARRVSRVMHSLLKKAAKESVKKKKEVAHKGRKTVSRAKPAKKKAG